MREQEMVAKKYIGAYKATVLTRSGVSIVGPRGVPWIGLDRPRPGDLAGKRRITWIQDKPDPELLPANWPPGAVVMYGGDLPFDDVAEESCGDPVEVLFGTPVALAALKDTEPGVVRCAGYARADDVIRPFTNANIFALTIWEAICRENSDHAVELMTEACTHVNDAVSKVRRTQSAAAKRNWRSRKAGLSSYRGGRPHVTIPYPRSPAVEKQARDSDDSDDSDAQRPMLRASRFSSAPAALAAGASLNERRPVARAPPVGTPPVVPVARAPPAPRAPPVGAPLAVQAPPLRVLARAAPLPTLVHTSRAAAAAVVSPTRTAPVLEARTAEKLEALLPKMTSLLAEGAELLVCWMSAGLGVTCALQEAIKDTISTRKRAGDSAESSTKRPRA